MTTKLKSFLMLLALLAGAVNGMWASSFKEYKFAELAEQAYIQNGPQPVYTVNMTGSYAPIIASQQIVGQYGTSTTYGTGNSAITVDFSKFAFRNNNNDKGWTLRRFDEYNKGLYWTQSTSEFAITNLRKDDEVTVFYRSNSQITQGNPSGNRTATFNLKSGSASWMTDEVISADDQLGTVTNGENSFKFKATADGDVIIYASTAAGTAFLTKIVIYRPDRPAVYHYDYSSETYDLTNKSWTISSIGSAGYKFYGVGSSQNAVYISNPDNYELNNRIVIMENQVSEYTYNNGLYNNSSSGARIVGINDLHDGDRVKITLTGTAHFLSVQVKVNNAWLFSAENDVFLDFDNDGQMDGEDDVLITAGTQVQSEAVYTMLSPGHLDICLAKYASIQKIEIISDRECGFVDTPNADGSHTLSFDGTGELKAKSAYIAGLIVEFSNAQRSNEAVHVTASDHGYKSVCEDYEGFKMARRTDLGTNVEKAPDAGTFYKFIPEVDGKLYFSFKATSIKYGSAIGNHNSSYEEVTGDQCPYYIIETDANGNTLQPYGDHYQSTPKSNGAWVGDPTPFLNEIQLRANHIYYIMGWWKNESDITGSCGVANAVSIRFAPDFSVTPLAKVVKNNTTQDLDLATVKGSGVSVSVKRKSNSITSCSPSIETINGEQKLVIRNITFNSDYDNAGVILLNVTDGGTPQVFALTIAYSASYNGGQGHIWDFSSDPLEIGRYFDDWFSNVGADGRGYMNNFHKSGDEINGQIYTGNDYFDSNVLNASSLLYQEMNDASPDWRLEYARKVIEGENTTYFDPMFVNVYPMEGDNAGMIWETGGLWFNTAANQSCLFNEKIGPIDRTNTTQQDPDRYVGIRKGGEFRIPKLYKDDRVIIFMGSAKGSGAEDEEFGGRRTLLFDIENARDAVYQEINDTYWVGGSQWNVYEATPHNHEDPNYRGAYHFFATGDPADDTKPADMVFKLTEGSLCKIYSIEIYHDGTHHYTNSILGSKYDLWNDNTSGNLTVGANGDSNQLDIHFRGKGEKIALNGGTIKNEVLTYTGSISNLTINTVNNSSISYTSKVGDFGTMLVRVKVMDYNNKYVTDFGDRCLTIGYKEKKSYPYTWDFTDMQLFSGTDIDNEDSAYPQATYADGTTPRAAWEDPKIWNISLWEKASETIDNEPVYKMNVYAPGCSQDGAETNAYYIFANNKTGGGNELYANKKIIPETQGLMFYMDNNDQNYNGNMWIAKDGLHLVNNTHQDWWNYKTVVPAVPSGAAVYLRVARDKDAVPDGATDFEGHSFIYKKYRFDHMPTAHYSDSGKAVDIKYEIGATTTEYAAGMPSAVSDWTYDETYNQYSKYYEAEDGSGDYIIAIYNWGDESDLHLTLNGYVLKKLSVSTDEKTVNNFGWNTESRDHAIDPSLMSYMTGKDFRAYVVTSANVEENTVTLVRIDGGSENTQVDTADNTAPDKKLIVPAATDGSVNACIVRYVDKSKAENKQTVNIFNDDKGFHLFVPDMHDAENAANNNFSGNLLKAQVSNTNVSGNVPRDEEVIVEENEQQKTYTYNNYAFTSRHRNVVMGGQWMDGPQAFYRIVSGGAGSDGNQAYLSIKASGTSTSRSAEPSNSSVDDHYDIVFKDWSDLMTEKGDVNGDGMVTRPDIDVLTGYVTARYSNGLFKRMGDMNDDGRVDIVDMTLLIQKIMSE